MSLASYLISHLGKLNDTLGYAESDLDAVVADTLMEYGDSNTVEADATDLKKLYALGKMFLWQKIMTDLAGDFDYSADGVSYKRGSFFDHAESQYSKAYSEAMQYLQGYQIDVEDIPASSGSANEYRIGYGYYEDN